MFFFSLMWASAVAGSSEYRAFDTAAWFRKGEFCQSMFRFLVGNFFCNGVPIVTLYLLQSQFRCLPLSFINLIAAAIASLSVFSMSRMLHTVMVSGYHKCFYSDKVLKDVIDKSNQDKDDKWYAHFIPGLLYAVGMPSLSLGLIGKFPSLRFIFCD